MIDINLLKRHIIDLALNGAFCGGAVFELKMFKKIADIYTGESTNESQKKKYSVKIDDSYPYVATKDVSKNAEVNYDNGMYIPKSESSFSIAPSGSVLLCIEGGSAGTKIAILDRDVCFVNKLCCFRPKEVESRYIYYFLQSSQFKKIFKDKMTGLIGGVSTKKIKELSVPIPDLEHQRIIVSKLDEIFAQIEIINNKQEHLLKLKNSFTNKILEMSFRGKLVEQRASEENGDLLLKSILSYKNDAIKSGLFKKDKSMSEIVEAEKPFSIPGNWVWARLGSITGNRGQTIPEKAFSYLDIGSIDNVKHVLSSEENLINPENAPSRARKIVEIGDVIYSTVRPYLHNICIVNREFSCQPIASTGFAVMACPPGLYNKYLFYCLLSPTFDEYANDTQNAKGTMYPAIGETKLANAVVPLPPYSEQKRIVEKIENILSIWDTIL